jgi:hypothetical protein
MMKSALEWALESRWEYRDMAAKLSAMTDGMLQHQEPSVEGLSRWVDRYPRSGRPLLAWLQEFCLWRDVLAHGQTREAHLPIWLEGEHLAFASMLFPLTIKVKLCKHGALNLEPFDKMRLANIERRLVCNPWRVQREIQDDPTHPWTEDDSNDRMRLVAFDIEAQMKSILDRQDEDSEQAD